MKKILLLGSGELGKEFVIAKSFKHQAVTFCPMAIYDNTTIEIYKSDGSKWINNIALQKGNSLYLGIGPNDGFVGLYMVTSQPVLCYLYTQGISAVYDIEDCTPSMAEVAPIDVGATEARWTFPAPTNSTNTPYSTTLIVSTEKGNDGNVTLDGTSTWTLTADSYVTGFTGSAANVIANGCTLYVNGAALTGTN